MDKVGARNSSIQLSRRIIVGGAVSIASVTALRAFSSPSVLGQATRTWLDIVTFAQDASRLSNLEAVPNA